MVLLGVMYSVILIGAKQSGKLAGKKVNILSKISLGQQ